MNFLRIFVFYIIVLKNVEATAHNEVKEAEDLFRRLFKVRRAEQLAAVKRIVSLDTEGKQKKMVLAASEKIFTMLRNNKFVLENAGFVPGVSNFPEDENIRDALSNLLENTALIGDVILHLPDISHALLSAHNDWVVLLGWSLQFANQTSLLDKQTITLIDLVSQEMNFTTRSDDYINPYKYAYISEREKHKNTINLTQPVKKKKKVKDNPRGPRLSSRGAGEL